MNDPLQDLLSASSQRNTRFPATSRYHEIETDTFSTPNGNEVIYLRRRIVPPPERFDLLQEHTVVEGDRLDNLAGHYLGDSQQYWRLCDANGAMRPDELTETVGHKLRITLPEGIPGNQNA